ncbi:MAG: porin [Myxococcota bacterium]|nr:porin [Myxococcota bacterium]
MYSISLLSSLFSSFAVAEEPLPAPEPYMLVQIWGTVYDQDEDPMADPATYGDPEDDVGFKVRRARFGFEGKDAGVKYAVTAGVSAPYDINAQQNLTEFQVVDAHIGLKAVKGLWVIGGMQKLPVSREQLMSSQEITLSERAVSSIWLVPNREIGMLADYTAGGKNLKARIRAGVFNGNESFLGDNNAGNLYAARAELVSGSGKVYQTYGSSKKPSIGIGVDYFMNNDLATTTTSFGADTMVRIQGLAVMAEARLSNIKPTQTDLADSDVFAEVDRFGYLVQLGYTINSFEPAVRYSTYDDNQSLVDVGDVSELLSGINYHWRDGQLRAGAGYVVRMETENAVVNNNTARLWLEAVY